MDKQPVVFASALAGGMALLLTVPGTASAQEETGYFGAGYGLTTNQDIDVGDDSDQGWKAFIGGGKGAFGLEGGYSDLGKFGGDNVNLKVKGWSIDGVLRVPVGPVRPFLKVGGFYADVSADVSLGPLSTSTSENSWELKYGAGLDWYFTKHVGVRAEYERYQIDNNDVLGDNSTAIDMATLSVLGRF